MKNKKLFKTVFGLGLVSLASCNVFIFGQVLERPVHETFAGTKNTIFFALYNYYGLAGQHFTNKWLGMNDALANHGYTVTDYEGQQDARRFKIKREANSDLPKDAVIYMVNNRTWDAGQQFAKPFNDYRPMAVISTCNGVDFASSPILSSGMEIANATMGGFSPTYRAAFENGSLRYLCAKYASHLLPIIAAAVDACDNGKAIRNADGSALRMSVEDWAIQTLDEYDEMSEYDKIGFSSGTLDIIELDETEDSANGVVVEVDPKSFLIDTIDFTLKTTGDEPETLNNEDFYWESSDESIATVRKGIVRGHKEGTAVITATNKRNSNVKMTKCIGFTNSPTHPTMKKINVDEFFDGTYNKNNGEAAAKLTEFASKSSKEDVKALYNLNANNKEEDEAGRRQGRKLRCGIIAPSSVNDQVRSYIDYIKGYLADIYNYETITYETTSTVTQDICAQNAVNGQCDFVVSLQDDTARNAAIELCNDNHVFFAIAGTCQNDVDYPQVKDMPYYVGSIGTSIQSERKSARKMTEYYLQCMIHRAAGDLEKFQKEYFGEVDQ